MNETEWRMRMYAAAKRKGLSDFIAKRCALSTVSASAFGVSIDDKGQFDTPPESDYAWVGRV